MLKYSISTLLYLSKINIKDTIQNALKLHNNIDIRLTITIKDKDGKIIKYHKQHSHSFVANFLNSLAESFAQVTISNNNNIFSCVLTNGSSDYVWSNFSVNGPNGNDTYGIVIGTGTKTPTPSDFKLGNQITNGTGNGQMVYNAMSFNPSSGTVTISGNTSYIQITRTFQNQSGASITVTETGIIGQMYDISGAIQYALMIHDLLSSSITVPNLSILQITYTISITT